MTCKIQIDLKTNMTCKIQLTCKIYMTDKRSGMNKRFDFSLDIKRRKYCYGLSKHFKHKFLSLGGPKSCSTDSDITSVVKLCRGMGIYTTY